MQGWAQGGRPVGVEVASAEVMVEEQPEIVLEGIARPFEGVMVGAQEADEGRVKIPYWAQRASAKLLTAVRRMLV